MGIILMQPDLGTASVFLPIFLIMSFMAGARLRHIAFILITFGLTFLFCILPIYEQYIIGREVPLFDIFTEWHILRILIISLVGMFGISLWGYLTLKNPVFYWIMYGGSILLLALCFAFAARIVLQQYQIMRLIIFINPNIDPKGAGWNIIQSLTAIGSGGFGGKGFLMGTQSHLNYLPQQSTDFIFSIIAEEWGFIGASFVLAMFLIIIFRGIRIISFAKDDFSVYIGAGFIGMFFFHVLINVGMAIGIMPITGIPLFFLSYGGSSLWTACISVGILLNICIRRYRY
jgi:rod shape determining protein RodA